MICMKKIISILMLLLMIASVSAVKIDMTGSQKGLQTAISKVENQDTKQILEQNMEKIQERFQERINECQGNCSYEFTPSGENARLAFQRKVKFLWMENQAWETHQINENGETVQSQQNIWNRLYSWGLAKNVN